MYAVYRKDPVFFSRNRQEILSIFTTSVCAIARTLSKCNNNTVWWPQTLDTSRASCVVFRVLGDQDIRGYDDWFLQRFRNATNEAIQISDCRTIAADNSEPGDGRIAVAFFYGYIPGENKRIEGRNADVADAD